MSRDPGPYYDEPTHPYDALPYTGPTRVERVIHWLEQPTNALSLVLGGFGFACLLWVFIILIWLD